MSDHQENRQDPMIALVSKIVAGYVSHNNVPPMRSHRLWILFIRLYWGSVVGRTMSTAPKSPPSRSKNPSRPIIWSVWKTARNSNPWNAICARAIIWRLTNTARNGACRPITPWSRPIMQRPVPIWLSLWDWARNNKATPISTRLNDQDARQRAGRIHAPFNQPFENSDPCFLGTNSFPPLADLD